MKQLEISAIYNLVCNDLSQIICTTLKIDGLGSAAKDICNICSEDLDEDDDGRTGIQCDECYQWVHCDCAGVGDSVVEDDFDIPFMCDECSK
jgi:hypothetical protein